MPLDIVLPGGHRRMLSVRTNLLITLALTGVLGLLQGLGVLTCTQGRGWLQEVAGTLAIVQLVVLPAMAAAIPARVLANLQRCGFLADARLTLLSPRSLCDPLAWGAVRSVVAPGVVYGIVLHAVDMDPWVLPWLCGLMLVTIAGAYMGEVQGLSKSRGRSWWDGLLTWLLVGLCCGSLVALGAWHERWLPAGLGGLLLLATVTRTWTLWHLELGESPLARLRLNSKREEKVNPYLRSTSRNPVVYRRAVTTALGVPWGQAGALLWRGESIILSLVMAVVLQHLGLPTQIASLAAAGLALLSYVGQAVWTGWHGVVADRPHLELLASTPMSAVEYVDGMAQSAALPRLWETWAGVTLTTVLTGGWLAGAITATIATGLLASLPVLVYGTLYAVVFGTNVLESMVCFGAVVLTLEMVTVCPYLATLVDAGVDGYALLVPKLLVSLVWMAAIHVTVVRKMRSYVMERIGKTFVF